MVAVDNFRPILTALSIMQSNVEKNQKHSAHTYLENFQKSRDAWAATVAILSSSDFATEAKLFAATTLKGKIIYDLDQLPREELPELRDSLLNLLSSYANGPKPVRTQLCVSLANLAIQMLEWKNVLELVGSSLGSSASDCVLDFLRVLPEEVTEGRKINLTEEDLDARTKELLEDNSGHVLGLLVRYAQSSTTAAQNPHLLECIASWTHEIPASDIVKSPLLDAVIHGLSVDISFEAAVDCLTTLYRETREVDESIDVIQTLYPRVLGLEPLIKKVADEEDSEKFKTVTRIFSEAGEAWVVLIARMPGEFRRLVEAILECCRLDVDREAISATFYFWSDLKQMVTVEKYAAARSQLADLFAKLVNVMIQHLEFPTTSGPNELDLFEGDRQQEENFREFRHKMGDVLKDCCEVISVKQCLNKTFDLIQNWITTYASQATETSVPHWQKLEAPLFAIRAMGRMVSKDEDVVLRQLIPLIVQIPDHQKLRFQAVMALGRYTEWTAVHPEYLQPQLHFVVSAFNHESSEVREAAALAFRFFGQDCQRLLQHELQTLHGFYDSVLDKLSPHSQEEITEGASYVVAIQSKQNIFSSLKLYCDPIVDRLKQRATKAQADPDNKALQAEVAETVRLLTIFVSNVNPYYELSEPNQAVLYCQELLPVLAQIVSVFSTVLPVLECVGRCWRSMVISHRAGILPVLPELARQLASSFEKTRQGCFLWATGAVLREFAADNEYVDAGTSQAAYEFFEQQAFAFLKIMDQLPPQDLPDVIEDFFHLTEDALIYGHDQFVPSAICTPIFTAALKALVLEQEHPLTRTLRYLEDLLSYGTDHPHSSSFGSENPAAAARNKSSVRALVSAQGEALVQRVLTGMMFTFPRDTLQDASSVLLLLFEMSSGQTANWIKQTLDMLPEGTIKPGESEKLLAAVQDKIQTGHTQRIRALLRDFTTSYRRRHVAPREGLGRLMPSAKEQVV